MKDSSDRFKLVTPEFCRLFNDSLKESTQMNLLNQTKLLVLSVLVCSLQGKDNSIEIFVTTFNSDYKLTFTI